MVSIDSLPANKDNIDVFFETLSKADVEFLVNLLASRHDCIHYAAFLSCLIIHAPVEPAGPTRLSNHSSSEPSKPSSNAIS